MAIESFGLSDTGCVRSNNEDHFLVDEPYRLFIVADGMGGHSSGEVASKMACEVIQKSVRSSLDTPRDPGAPPVVYGTANESLSETTNFLISGVRVANKVIHDASTGSPEHAGMGTTAVAVIATEKAYSLAWVGDSRIYLVRRGQLQRLTVDHSVVQEQITQGLITPEQAEISEFKNILTRALGPEADVQVDGVELAAADNDIILLCTDGLTRMVSEPEILEISLKFARTQDICATLVEKAKSAGGRDNITVVAVQVRIENMWDRFINAVSKIG